MLENSGKPEISGDRRENEVGIEQRNEEEGGEGCCSDSERLILSGNRWPQQETLDLLNIRSDMDAVFRDSASKAPLWNEVSRRMSELGYDRSGKKCKEKFENLFKYHRKLKTSSHTRSNGKTYRFFDRLEALAHYEFSFPTSAPKHTDTTTKNSTLTIDPCLNNSQVVPQISVPPSVHIDSTSDTTSSGSESEGARKKKRKWAVYFDKLVKSVLDKQEDLQKRFLEAIDKNERERLAREEEWKMQEMGRIKREHELLMQERALTAAKDAAVLAFLQKVSEQGTDSGTHGGQMAETMPSQEKCIVHRHEKHSGENSSSRWPREEVETLIRIRSNMDLEYQRLGSKGSLWEDISLAMKKAGYDRNTKRCKEKWENINKYYRRVKDNNRKRPHDSRTCPYFHLLDALYSTKSKMSANSSHHSPSNLKPEELLMHMMNHHSGQHHQEQVLQQEQGEMIMDHEPIEYGKDNQVEDEDDEYDGTH